MNPETSIQYLKGVGPARAKSYQKLGIRTLRDLVYHFPRRYLDLGRIIPIGDASTGETCVIQARVAIKYPPARIRGGLVLYKLLACDDSGSMTVTIFNAKYAFESLKTEETYLFYGVVKQTRAKPEMPSPLIFPAGDVGGLMPVYPLTAGLNGKIVSQNVRQALSSAAEELIDPLPAAVRDREHLCTLSYALQNIHFPPDAHAVSIARRRLIFEELFTLTLALRSIRSRQLVHTQVHISGFSPEAFYQSLPFSPTGAQRRAVAEILADLEKGVPMSRLLQGDVGSGKTLVAATACLAAIQGGYQCAVMAPTEILAVQHYHTFSRFLSPFGVRITLLTGSMKAKEKREALENIQLGLADLVVGTHALISGNVAFQRLGLAVTDEQHRFGVAQRTALQEKSEHPHVLVMSATPIPRTLALIIYGDLDLSVLDELPAGRKPVATYCIPTSKLERAYGFIKGHLDAGRQAYIVCPLVDNEEEGGDLHSAEQTARELQENVFCGYRVDILHGKLPAAKKEEIMRRFQEGDIQLLICTTVVEVGVDVPNAVVMMCLDAERFGLSQLHQLRGRVGRGEHPSSCILVSDARGEAARERLSALCHTNDGFAVAQTDLKLRGPGDFFGSRQHGLPEMRIADMAEDVDVLTRAQEAALALLKEDPGLKKPEHLALQKACARIMESVGQRPN